MTDEEFDAALEHVIRSTGVRRYRYLATEQPDPTQRALWREWIAREARNLPHPAPALPADHDTSWLPGPCGGCP